MHSHSAWFQVSTAIYVARDVPKNTAYFLDSTVYWTTTYTCSLQTHTSITSDEGRAMMHVFPAISSVLWILCTGWDMAYHSVMYSACSNSPRSPGRRRSPGPVLHQARPARSAMPAPEVLPCTAIRGPASSSPSPPPHLLHPPHFPSLPTQTSLPSSITVHHAHRMSSPHSSCLPCRLGRQSPHGSRHHTHLS